MNMEKPELRIGSENRRKMENARFCVHVNSR
jgi:hypothetical protein